MKDVYGDDLLLLIGGSLYSHSDDLAASARHFLEIAGRTDLWSAWARHAAGSLSPVHDSNGRVVVITRHWNSDENLSLGTETFIPKRLLLGVIPECLLDTHSY